MHYIYIERERDIFISICVDPSSAPEAPEHGRLVEASGFSKSLSLSLYIYIYYRERDYTYPEKVP